MMRTYSRADGQAWIDLFGPRIFLLGRLPIGARHDQQAVHRLHTPPALHKEPLDFDHVHPAQRSYK